tara:strand:- start:2740 stop:3498 length:759 start_codon:yes stop_codon:yes gene_type:complete
MSPNGRIAAVTGAGTGIGKSAVIKLLGAGYSVALAGRRMQPLLETIEESGADDSTAIAVSTDVSKPDSIYSFFHQVKERFGRLDVLFNNAGIGAPRVEFEELSLDDWQKVVDTNLTGSFLCAQQAVKIMKSQSPMGGRIINNGSISAYAPRPDSVAYTSTKHAISGLTKQISLDGRKYNIACSQVDVGNAATPMTMRMQNGVPQANGEIMVEPTFDVDHVGQTILQIADYPLETNVQNVTIMATKMPFVGRG